MRKLTITREKSPVGSLMKVKFYIQDPLSQEVEIKGCGCRKLGELKNAEVGSFEINQEELVLYSAIDDELVKSIKSMQSKKLDITKAVMDQITIPAGQEDVIVSGKNKFHPFRGNPFLFSSLSGSDR